MLIDQLSVSIWNPFAYTHKRNQPQKNLRFIFGAYIPDVDCRIPDHPDIIRFIGHDVYRACFTGIQNALTSKW